ncbi:hypothetical protein MLD38_031337 [Melastoma candidum]|uniref:Uncharacterized protein n=1 Tax=Melastoma candidum TaxID=119954 RepID=A0ACB9MNQ5_9MYRT|nr:hypothetical protein MLD38_031337 [Melastoma candidum]
MRDKPYSNTNPHPPHPAPRPPPPWNLPPRLLRLSASASNNNTSHSPTHDLPGRHPPSSFLPHQLFRKKSPPSHSFVLELRSLSSTRPSRTDVVSVVSEFCRPAPSDYDVCSPGNRAIAALSFSMWPDARDAVVSLWSSRLARSHAFSPVLVSDAPSAAEAAELRDRLKLVFIDWIEEVVYSGEVMKRWDFRLLKVKNELEEIKVSLSQTQRLRTFNPLIERQKGLNVEKVSIERRLREFRDAVFCVRDYLEGIHKEGNRVFAFPLSNEKGFDFDWCRIHLMVLRECKRLEEGLPIYARRSDILCKIHGFQVMILVGETGSGKSTQLVQYLADSGVAADCAIVCTQPRKIAAVSLSERVRDESAGCYGDNAVSCYPVFSSYRRFDSKITFTTDTCLLRHYMHDKDLSRISCVIVDEAHERSLSTDLLLAMLKQLLGEKPHLRLIIMSATADAKQLSDYFYGCEIFHVLGRNFPVDIIYKSLVFDQSSHSAVASYVSDTVRTATEIHKKEGEGTILAFLTSQSEVEWACDNFQSPTATALPLHGKLTHEEQTRVFQNFEGKRKVIFSTNIAETSLTIPGVKYVIDSGMAKESKFEARSGMNVLRVSPISKSSAKQRAGRAGRTEPGCCYRLYSEYDFESMPDRQEPEIRRVSLGIAVLKILALGVKNLKDFDFVDAPPNEAIAAAIRNLVQLGAITSVGDAYELTGEGWNIVKLGTEPRLGKMVLSCFAQCLGKEGIVLAAVMANASTIFCRVGTDEDKLKSDCIKVQFCHCGGDLFTLLSVYREWEAIPPDLRNKWCWDNSINAKSMRRCHDTVKEFKDCLWRELNVSTPPLWRWNPSDCTELDAQLKKIILSCLSENVAMFSGNDKLGYEVALSRQHVQLHPSCSLLTFGQKPGWVIFSEILSLAVPYLVCVTAFDFEFLSALNPRPLFDFLKIERKKLQLRVITGYGCTLLKRFCGRGNTNVLSLESFLRKECVDERISIQVNVDENEVSLFASLNDIEKVYSLCFGSLECQRRWMQNECLEKLLYHGPGVSAPLALFGSGAEIKHLELDGRILTVDVSHSNCGALDDNELLVFLEGNTYGNIVAVQKYPPNRQEGDYPDRWARVTFLSPDAAKQAFELNGVEFSGGILTILPSRLTLGSDNRMFSFPAVRAKVSWPRRISKGYGILKCDRRDLCGMLNDLSNLIIGGKFIRCEVSNRCCENLLISGLGKELSDDEVLYFLRSATNRPIRDFFLVRGDAVESVPYKDCQEALLKEITPFMPKSNPLGSRCQVQVFPSEPKDAFTRALIIFDGRLHLEAAKALEQIEGRVLPGCLPWQKMKCQQLFHSSLSCPASVYCVIKEELDALLASFRHIQGCECSLDRSYNGCYRVKISAPATRVVAELLRPVEELMRGKTIDRSHFIPAMIQLLFSRDGITLMRTVQHETGTWVLFDRHTLNVRIFGGSEKVSKAEHKLIESLLNLYESKKLEIQLRGRGLPTNLMKAVVESFGPKLNGLKDKVPDAEFSLNVRQHVISVKGDMDAKEKAEAIIHDLTQSISLSQVQLDGKHSQDCSICLCEVDDGYQLEGCGHMFCRLCLVEQFESAIKNLDSFPIRCAHEGCGVPIWIVDMKILLSTEKSEELFRASLSSHVASSGGLYRFCPSPDCPSVYRVSTTGEPFACEACHAETCTTCHLEYHPYFSCKLYRRFKNDPDSSVLKWCVGKEHVQRCPCCGFIIEKVDGCNHVECRCGKHICWMCLEVYATSDDCYSHLRSIHNSI